MTSRKGTRSDYFIFASADEGMAKLDYSCLFKKVGRVGKVGAGWQMGGDRWVVDSGLGLVELWSHPSPILQPCSRSRLTYEFSIC